MSFLSMAIYDVCLFVLCCKQFEAYYVFFVSLYIFTTQLVHGSEAC